MIAAALRAVAALRPGACTGRGKRPLLACALMLLLLLAGAPARADDASRSLVLAQAPSDEEIDAREDRREALADRRDRRLDARRDRREARADRRERRLDARADRRDRRLDAREDRRERLRDAREEGDAAPADPRGAREDGAPGREIAPDPDPDPAAADVDERFRADPPTEAPEGPGPGEDPGVGAGTGATADAPRDGVLPRVVGVVPEPLRVALVVLTALALALAIGFLATRARARRQRERLRGEIGLLERALLPEVPEWIGGLRTSVAHTSVEGRAAGGDFYDVFELADGRVGIVVGDMSGHGGDALASTAHVRYMLRAYLDAGLSPREALNTAGVALADALGDGFATAVVCLHDPARGTLSYANAGHPAPLLMGPPSHEPVSTASSPPLGLDIATGLRETTVSFPPGSLACFFTDGVIEARTEGELLGRDGLARLVSPMGSDATAETVLEHVAHEADATHDDMVVCVIRAVDGADPDPFRTEDLRFGAADLEAGFAHSFLRSLDVPPEELYATTREARKLTSGGASAVVRVRLDENGPTVELLEARGTWPSGAERTEATPA